jgi:DNA-binding LacI/PurR family transcriptional regulator
MSRHKVPFVAFNYSKRADLLVRLDCSDAVAAFVDHCRRAKVKSVVEVTVGSSLASAAAALRKAGVECTSWPIVRRSGYGIEDISKATLKAFYDRIRLKGRSWLPDVLYFNDNFASQSALLALVDSGIDIPGDVRLVTWSNAGEGPYWRKSLARIEIDPIEVGHKFARHVLAFLDGKRLDDPASVSPKYIAGETFPHT